VTWWNCSGDTDSVVPVTATRFAISHLGLKIKTRWYPWYSAGQVLNLKLVFKQSWCCCCNVSEFEMHLVLYMRR